MRHFLSIVLVLSAGAARASSISNEVSSNSTQATETNPRAGNLADALNATLDLSDQWALNAGATLTAEGQTPALQRGAFGSSGNAVTSFSLGVEWQPTDSWSTGVSFDFSPESTQYTGTQVQVNAAGTPADALLRSKGSSFEAGLDLSYDTSGDSSVEWSFAGGLSTTHLSTDQQITRVRTKSGAAATPQQIRDYCAAHKCSPSLLAALRPQTGVSLDSQRLNAAVTAILSKDTDLTLSGDYYLYDQDPTQVGYYSVARVGRVGNGLNIAPVQFSVRPEVAHRFGDFSAKVWVQAGQYVSGGGQSTTGAGLRLQYKFTKAFKLWASASGQHDIDQQSNATNSGSVALGAGYRF